MSQREEDLDLVQSLLDIEESLTDWEIEFAESISKRIDTWDRLTDKQREKAESIAGRFYG